MARHLQRPAARGLSILHTEPLKGRHLLGVTQMLELVREPRPISATPSGNDAAQRFGAGCRLKRARTGTSVPPHSTSHRRRPTSGRSARDLPYPPSLAHREVPLLVEEARLIP